MMLGARTAAWSGKALPYDAEVEWLQGDGASYIDGFIDFSNVSAKTTLVSCTIEVVDQVLDKFEDADKEQKTIFGIYPRKSSQTGCIRVQCPVEDDKTFYVLPFSALARSAYLHSLNDGKKITATIVKSNQTLATGSLSNTHGENNTSSITSFNNSYFTPEGYTPILFGIKYPDGEIVALSHAKINSFKCKNEFTSQEVDMIPVRKDGVGYMYDKISGQLFGNAAGKGAFVIGPDKTT